MQRLRARCFAFLLTAGIAVAAADARASDPNEGGTAAAESLFQEARKLMDAKRYAEACPKLVASHKLAPAVGTLLNLADCYERAGQNASAWARFHEAIGLAQRLHRPDREKTARSRAEKLEPRLIRLSIIAQEKDVEVTLDGNVLDPAALGSPVPVDPGKHSIEATAKGKKPFNTTIDVGERSKSPSVEIPELEVDPAASKPVDDKNEGDRSPVTDGPPSSGSTQRTVSYVLMGVGLAGAGVGTIFGLRTSSKWKEAQTHCTGVECDRTGVTLAAEAKNNGTVSTISFIAGGVLLASGVALFFTAPRRGSKAPSARANDVRVGIGPGSVTVVGAF